MRGWERISVSRSLQVSPELPGFPEWAQAGPDRRAHVERVAGLVASWADAIKVTAAERDRWLRAVYLHDALRDAPHEFLQSLAANRWRTVGLLHGPAAAELAARKGERDQGVLDAVRYHSVGFAGWDQVGRMLYLGDYLEPGRAFREAERRAMAARVPLEPEQVLRHVATERLQWLISSGWPLIPETAEFWNALARAS